MTVITIIGVGVILAAACYFLQRKMIYYPRAYEVSPDRIPGIVALEYRTGQGRQVSYYSPPRSAADGPPERLWLVFSGNAGRALDWLDFLDHPDIDPGHAFLLVEYPGYGQCEGKSSQACILDATGGAYDALATDLGVEPEVLDRDVNVLAHSLGAAAGLQWAASHPVRSLVLVSPFTTMSEMARGVVGAPLHLLLLDRYDNLARLKELAARKAPPRVTLIHGDADTIVPFRMSERLAEPTQYRTGENTPPDGWIRLIRVPGGDHNWILQSAADKIVGAMSR